MQLHFFLIAAMQLSTVSVMASGVLYRQNDTPQCLDGINGPDGGYDTGKVLTDSCQTCRALRTNIQILTQPPNAKTNAT